MKKIILSWILALVLITNMSTTAMAADHTYYSQYGWVNNVSLCYCACVAMSLNDLGIPTTPMDGKTSKPVVSVNNNNATVSWSHSGKASSYDVYLVQSPWRWEDIKYHLSTTSTSCVFENVVPGDYQAFVIARPNKDTKQSEWTAFTVQSANSKNVKIAFNANGGNVSQSYKTVTPGSTYGTLPSPTRSGYTFDGWYTSANSGSQVTSSTKFAGSSDVVLYAHWTKEPVKKVTITFDANGGRASFTSKQIEPGSYLTGLPTATRSGYTFLGWAMDKIDPDASGTYTTSVVSENSFTFDEDTTLYAYWRKDRRPCTVSFDANGGNVSQSSKTVSEGYYCGDLPLPIRSGYTFDGWYTASSGGSQVTSRTTVDSDMVLYAHWSIEETICSHTKGSRLYSDSTHPHYNYYSCSKCGESFTDYSTTPDTSCEDCWGAWSGWSSTPAYESSTRQVEARTVQTSDGAVEYRYGRYIDSTGGHICWCSTYLGGKGYSGIRVQYSDWSTTRYGTTGKDWSCGYCDGSHTGIDHYDSTGRPWWKEYSLSSGNYFWEESRQTSGSYETQYRYRDLIGG